MPRIINIKNNTLENKIWCGTTIIAGEYYNVDPKNFTEWGNNADVLTAVTNQEAIINNGDKDITDINFAINYLKGHNFYQEQVDNRLNVHETSRALGTTTMWTSVLDDLSSPEKVWGGQMLLIEHNIGDDAVQSVVGQINSIENKTYIHEGYLQFKNANWDTIDILMLPRVTNIKTGTTYRNYNGIMLVPEFFGSDFGETVDVDGDIHLVEVIREEPQHDSRVGFWDADYDTATKTFSNITPNISMKGRFNIFSHPYCLEHFVISHLMSGSTNNTCFFESADSSRVGHNMQIKMVATTRGEDREWSCGVALTLHRERTS